MRAAFSPTLPTDGPFDRALSFGILSSYPPTACGLATFTTALSDGLSSHGAEVGVVRVADGTRATSPRVIGELQNGSPASVAASTELLNQCDVAVIQHEYGLFGGADGDEVLEVLANLRVPSILIAHTIFRDPTPHQRDVLIEAVALSDRVVVMSEAARLRLCTSFDVDPARVETIAHGAAVPPAGPARKPVARPIMLTWGLIGPGKGIERVLDAMPALQRLPMAPRYLVAGRTHPKVLASDGEQYREARMAQARRLGVEDSVCFDDDYRDMHALNALIAASAVVVLPYDSTDQVTSGVLVDAIAAGKPVVATAFAHAEELLASGAGIVVPHEDPDAMASALRRVLTEPGLAARMAAEASRLAPALGWPVVAGEYLRLARQLVSARARPGVKPTAGTTPPPRPNFAHIVSMSDRRGTFEHAEFAVPRREHGYCTDDMARVLVAAVREPAGDPAVAGLVSLALRFLVDAQGVSGGTRNRMNRHGHWEDLPRVEDAWGRAIWGLGTAAAHAADAEVAATASDLLGQAALQRSLWPRAMAFATLGAAELLGVQPDHAPARALLADAAAVMARPTGDAAWPWPELRLAYGNAVLPEAMIAAGTVLDDATLRQQGLDLLGWLLAHEMADGHISVTPTGGAAAGEVGPRFDQQPIEVAALADACARAATIDDSGLWPAGVAAAAAWFLGDNDARVVMWDPATGGGFDGLEEDGANLNQGTESTLAFLTTLQHVRRPVPVPQ